MLRIFLTLFLLTGLFADGFSKEPAALLYKQYAKQIHERDKKATPQASSLIIKFKNTSKSETSIQAMAVQSVSRETFTLKPLWKKQATHHEKMDVQSSSATFDYSQFYVADIAKNLMMSEKEALKDELSRNPDIAYVQWNHYYSLDAITESFTPNDSTFGDQWNLAKIQAPEAWEITKGDPSVKIGIIDTGIDYTHPDLIPNLYINPDEDHNKNGTFEPWPSGEKRNPITFELDPNGLWGDFDSLDQDQNGYTDDVIGWDFTNQPLNADNLNGFSDYETPDPDPFDENSHGTACAGIVAAATNNAIGVSGIAPNCKLVALRVFTALGYADDKDIASAIVYAADNNIRVLNMSFGDVIISPLLKDAIQYAHEKGVVMCASSGNAGGDGQHYPSGYDEVISTVATSPSEDISTFSTYGITVDVAAPGEGIITTMPFYDNYYTDSYGGTSAAAPHSAGIAALILSQHPEYTPDQVRGVLVSTADDIALEGWDHFSGAGRVNAYRALQSTGTPVAKILSPTYDAGFSTEPELAIVGTATSPTFDFYRLSYTPGTTYGGSWETITESPYQKIQDTLGVWPISSLNDSTYTLRLAVHQKNGQTIEVRERFFIDRSAPIIDTFAIRDTYLNEKHGLLITGITDDLTQATIHYRRASSGLDFMPYTLTEIKRTHEALLQSDVLIAGIVYEFFMVLKNRSGLISYSDTLKQTLDPEIIQTPTLGGFSFTNKSAQNLPKGYYLKTLADFNQNGKFELLLNEALPREGKKFGDLKRFEYNTIEQRFMLLDSVSAPYIPRDIKDFNQDGLKEVLVQSGGKTILFSQASLNASPFSSILFADTLSGDFWGALMADTKGDGKLELLARNDTAFFILDQSFSKIATLENPVKIAKDGSKPSFEEPKVLVEDFDQDGRPEILMGDYDANFFMYEYSGAGNAYQQTWLRRTAYIGGSNSMISGKFLANGKTQFIIGYHSDNNLNERGDFDPQVWVFECYQATGDNAYVQLWEKAFYNYKPAFFFPGATAAGDIDNDGKDELIILAYPNLYIFTWSMAKQTFVPIWLNPAAAANELVLDDLDGNGLKDIIFSDDLNAKIYEYQNFTGPLAPVGIEYEPLSDSAVSLSWLPVEGATAYNIYRDIYSSVNKTPTTLLAQTSATSFLDTTVSGLNDRLYIYAVTAQNASMESDTSNYFIVKPHLQPRLVTANYEDHAFLRLGFSEPISPFELNASNIVVKHQSGLSLSPASLTLAKGGLGMIASFKSSPLAPGDYTVEAHSLVDIYQGKLDTLYRSLPFSVEELSTSLFYIVGSNIVSKQKLSIEFNKPVLASSAENFSNYQLSPFGEVTGAQLSNSNKTLTLTISGVELGGLGFSQTLEIQQLLSEDGSTIDAQNGGNIISFDQVKENLKNAFVYPNPYRISGNSADMMFANLTQSGTIDIYTLSGKHIQRIIYNTKNGGVQWNANAKDGKKLATGIYIYRIKSSNDEEKFGKLAIIK